MKLEKTLYAEILLYLYVREFPHNWELFILVNLCYQVVLVRNKLLSLVGLRVILLLSLFKAEKLSPLKYIVTFDYQKA